MKPLIYLIFIGFVALLISCENDLAEIKRVVGQEETAIERAKEVEILYSDSAMVKVRIKAPVMLNYLDKKDPRREFPDGVNVDVFDTNKKVVSMLTAKYAIQKEKEKNVFLQDSVVVVTLKNERLEAEELTWDESNERIYTEKYVKMSTPTEIIEGYGFNSNIEFTNWSVKNVTGIIDASDIMGDDFE